MALDDTLKDLLVKQEALVLKPYTDTVGKLTIGVGRNLTDKGISREEAFFMLDNDIKEVKKELIEAIPWVEDLDENRQIVLYDMAFNLGVNGLLEFKQTLSSIQSRDFKEAADRMLNSRWASQVGNRAVYLAKIMETGEL